MSRHEKVTNTFKMPAFTNLLYDGPVITRTAYANSFGPKTNTDERKEAFRSINCNCKSRSSIEKIIAQNKCTDDAHILNSLAVERKRKRKSFFERICGNKAVDEVVNKIELATAQHTKTKITYRHEKKKSMTSDTNSDKLSVQANRTGGLCGSSSTVDSSCLSSQRMSQEEKNCAKKGFPGMKIKKSRLTKNTNSKLEFLPLINHFSSQKPVYNTLNSSLKRFEESKINNCFTDFRDDLNAWDGKWANLEENELNSALSNAMQ